MKMLSRVQNYNVKRDEIQARIDVAYGELKELDNGMRETLGIAGEDVFTVERLVKVVETVMEAR